MNCKQADAYMMKFMDNTYTEEETEMFNIHLKECISCRESFSVYQEMMESFPDMEIHEVPENLKSNIMEEVYKSSQTSKKLRFYMEKIVYGSIGLFFLLIGISLSVIINKDIILQTLSKSENVYARILIIALDILGRILVFILNSLNSTFNFILNNSIIILLMSILSFCMCILVGKRYKFKNDVPVNKLRKM